MYLFVKRFFDISSSIAVLLILSPFLLVISILIMIDSKGGAFYKQQRIGRNQQPFFLYKFRSMRAMPESGLKVTIGNDPRITKVGAFIRKYKIDEFPQLINIILGHMSVVGPRPEVKEYVDLYSDSQLEVLSVKPGLTDFASIKFFNEQELLGKSKNPEKFYVEKVMPEKLELNLEYVSKISLTVDMLIIIKTLLKIFR